jgi:hypothetical protein
MTQRCVCHTHKAAWPQADSLHMCASPFLSACMLLNPNLAMVGGVEAHEVFVSVTHTLPQFLGSEVRTHHA